MRKSSTPAGVVPAAIVEEAWQQVGASFERFCLTAGIATLAGMMEGDAARLCGVRYGRDDGKDGYRWGRAKGKLGFHGGKIELERPRVRARAGSEIALPSWEAAMAEDWLGRWALNLMLINVSTRKFGRAMRLPEGDVPAAHGAGLSKSAASRRFIALSAERMKEWMASDLSKLDLRSAFLARAATGRWKKPSARRGKERRFHLSKYENRTRWVGRKIRMIPLAAIPPPIITPSEITIGLTRCDAATRDTAQMLVPITQRMVPIMNFR